MRPITPQPGYTDADLIALLKTKRFIYVDCFTFFNKDGQVLRYSTAQRPVQINTPVDGSGIPVQYVSNQLKVSGLIAETSVGVNVDEQELSLSYSDSLQYQGMSFSEALLVGRFDGSTIRRDRYFSAAWGSPWVGGAPYFVGSTSGLDKVGRSGGTLKVKSVMKLFDTQMPRKVYQPGCLHVFGDPGCGIDRSLYATNGVAGAGSTSSTLFWAGAVANMQAGTVQIVDDNGATEVRTIDSVDVGVALNLAYPLDFSPDVGANFTAIRGCVRTYAACGGFDNTANYQGFPFVPVAETASGSV